MIALEQRVSTLTRTLMGVAQREQAGVGCENIAARTRGFVESIEVIGASGSVQSRAALSDGAICLKGVGSQRTLLRRSKLEILVAKNIRRVLRGG